MNVRLTVVSVLAAGTVLAGCQSTIDGNPQSSGGNPTEPSFPTSQPSRTGPTPPPTTPPPTTPRPTTPPTSAIAAPRPAAEALRPQNGYVFITTKSGQTRCQINAAEVDCEAPFTNPPTVSGVPANGVRLTSAGKLEWISGNLGDIPVVTIDYRTYSALRWTIVAGEDGTRFTNDDTGHGMFVAIQGVDAF